MLLQLLKELSIRQGKPSIWADSAPENTSNYEAFDNSFDEEYGQEPDWDEDYQAFDNGFDGEYWD